MTTFARTMVKLAVLVGIRPSKTSSRLQVSVAESDEGIAGSFK